MKNSILVLGTLLMCLPSFGQKKYTLQTCISTALSNNVQIKQGQLQVQVAQNQTEQLNYQKYPNVNFSMNQGVQTGRSIDPFSNGFVEKAIGFNSFNVSAGMNLFNGFQLKNSIIQSQQNLSATQKEVESNKNMVTVNVATAYLGVLNGMEQLESARRQIEASRLQLDRTQKLVKGGAVSQVQLYDLESQIANDELNIVNAQNNVELAKLTLKQLMNIPANEIFDIERINLTNPSLQPYDATLDQIYNAALKYLPDMEAANLRVESAKTGVEIAKGLKMPTISLGGGISSSYSTAAPDQRFVSDGGAAKVVDVPSSTKYVQYAGIKVPVIESLSIPSGDLQNFGYFRQLGFNRSPSLSLSLRMPIFNGYQAKYRIAGAQIQEKNAVLVTENIKNQIRQSVEQAYYSMLNAAKRYEAIQKQVQSLELSFKAAEARLNAGALTAVEYNITKNNLDRALLNLIQAKYDFVFRTKILDFYQNKPLTLD
jgi:outer membrane protein